MNAAKFLRALKRLGGGFVCENRKEGAIAALSFLLDEGLNDLDDYERIRTLKEDLERER